MKRSLDPRIQAKLSVGGSIEVLLLLDTNHSNPLPYEVVGRKSSTSLSTVRKVVKLYSTEGLDGVLNLKRSPNSNTSKTKIDGPEEAKLIMLACGPAPEGRARWTLRLQPKNQENP